MRWAELLYDAAAACDVVDLLIAVLSSLLAMEALVRGTWWDRRANEMMYGHHAQRASMQRY